MKRIIAVSFQAFLLFHDISLLIEGSQRIILRFSVIYIDFDFLRAIMLMISSRNFVKNQAIYTYTLRNVCSLLTENLLLDFETFVWKWDMFNLIEVKQIFDFWLDHANMNITN